YVQGITIYVSENSTDLLRCPYTGSTIQWRGPPAMIIYTLGLAVNPALPHRDRISVVGQTEQGEYNLQISNIQQSDRGEYQCSGIVNGNAVTWQIELHIAGKVYS
ncbi:Hypothetical predicted protein, partial [Mytilus galloprovincialis]